MQERLIIHNPTKGNSSTGKSIPCFTDSLSYPITISAAMVLWAMGACTHLTNTRCFSYILVFPLIVSLAFANFYPAVPPPIPVFLSYTKCCRLFSVFVFFPSWFSLSLSDILISFSGRQAAGEISLSVPWNKPIGTWNGQSDIGEVM